MPKLCSCLDTSIAEPAKHRRLQEPPCHLRQPRGPKRGNLSQIGVEAWPQIGLMNANYLRQSHLSGNRLAEPRSVLTSLTTNKTNPKQRPRVPHVCRFLVLEAAGSAKVARSPAADRKCGQSASTSAVIQKRGNVSISANPFTVDAPRAALLVAIHRSTFDRTERVIH